MLERAAEIDPSETYRYALRRTWNDSRPIVLFVMLNPSTADANKDDQTIKKCMGLASRWGFGSLWVGNLFAYRSTDPRALTTARKEGKDVVGPENDWWLARMGAHVDSVVAAWGADKAVTQERVTVIHEIFAGRLSALRLTKHGHPMHPLFIAYDTRLVEFSPCP